MFSALPFFKRSKPPEDEATLELDADLEEAASSSDTPSSSTPSGQSARALGSRGELKPPPAVPTSRKRRHDGTQLLPQADSLEASTSTDSLAAPPPKDKVEKRVTRSTLVLLDEGGEGGVRGSGALRGRKRSDSSDSENGWIPPAPLLLATTAVRLTTRPPSPSALRTVALSADDQQAAVAHLGTSLAPPSPSTQPVNDGIATKEVGPSFRMLSETELIPPGRTRGGPSTSAATSLAAPSPLAPDSDAHFHRLHRFPEVLEKRSKRREKERLVHARFNLRATLDALRNTSDGKTIRSLVAARWREEAKMTGKPQVVGDTELDRIEYTRRRMIKEVEETLKRYDALLEPRRDNVMTRTGSATSLSDQADSSTDSFRGPSPAPPPMRRPVSRPSAKQVGPTRGVLKTGSGLSLKMLFRGAGGQFTKKRGPGRPPKQEKLVNGTVTRTRPARTEPVNKLVEDGDDADVSMESVDQPRPSRGPGRPRKDTIVTRVRTQDSFFDSAALRDTVLSSFASSSSLNSAAAQIPAPGPPNKRRISHRVQHAFGMRVPDFPSEDIVRDFDPLQAEEDAGGDEGEGRPLRRGRSLRNMLEQRQNR